MLGTGAVLVGMQWALWPDEGVSWLSGSISL